MENKNTKTKEEIQNEFNNSSDKVGILYNALDIMQQYNGRSKLDCIAIAMGYEVDYDNENIKMYIKNGMERC